MSSHQFIWSFVLVFVGHCISAITIDSVELVFKDISQYDKGDLSNISNHSNNKSTVSLNHASIVYTEYGYIEGILTETARVFRQIPYAKPPVNSSGRWQKPREPNSWGPTKILEAKGNPPACPQYYCGQWEACGRNGIQVKSEDCLYLNVYTPINMSTYNDSGSQLLPVMFYIHGGQYQNGYGGGYLYNGTDITNLTNVITVTINYRLGILGFYWNDNYGFEGNYGIEDQIMALKWVHNNIEYFGGDPSRVTIWGQSAGSMSIGTLLQISEARQYFSNVIWESEPLGIPMRNADTWGEIPQLVVTKANCIINTKKCLYKLNVTEILDIQYAVDTSVFQVQKFMDAFVPWTPTFGTGFADTQPFWYFQNKSNIIDKSLIAGVTKNEGELFIYSAFPNGISRALMLTLLRIVVKTDINVAKVLLQYPLPSNDTTNDYRDYASMITTDAMFHCPNRNLTSIMSQNNNNNNNIYYFHFEHVPSFSSVIWDPINATECLTSVCHGDDLPFVFRPNGGPLNVTWPTEELDLSMAMQFYLAQFSKTNNPGNGRTFVYNNGTVVEWLQFNNITQETMKFQTFGIELVSNYDKDKCILWDQIGYPWMPRP